MKILLLIGMICTWCVIVAQNPQSQEQIRKEMARIRQTTNWDDPAAAKKANEEIKKLAQQLSGGKPAFNFNQNTAPEKTEQVSIQAKATDQQTVVRIAERFFQSSYKKLDAIAKTRFDDEYRNAEKENFKLTSIRKLSSTGAFQMQFSYNLDEACVYMTSAVKNFPQDTVSVNNFGAYLRMIDSTKTSLSVLLYANSLYSQSPVILTQIGCSYFELKDIKKAEYYLKEALKTDPVFGQASSTLCDLYLQTGRWKDALQALFSAVVGNGISYGQAHNAFGTIKNATIGNSGGSSSIAGKLISQNSAANSQKNDTKGDFWDENNAQIRPEDMLSSLEPDANIPDNEKLAPLVPPDNHFKMPPLRVSAKLEDWTWGGGFNEAVSAYQSFFNTLMAFNSEFQKVHQLQPAIAPNAFLRDYPNERFAIDCILEYFGQKSQKETKAYIDKVSGLPAEAGVYLENYIKKHGQYLEEKANCLKSAYDNYKGCMVNCTHYPSNTEAREICERNCAEKRIYSENECNRIYCLNDCNAANECNAQMNGGYGQFTKEFAGYFKKQEENLNDLYGFTDKWFARIYSPYWSKIYAYEIGRVAMSIIGNVYASYQQGFPATVRSDCGSNCSDYVVQPPVPVAQVIPKEMKGNDCPNIGKHKFGFGVCDLGFDCESVEFGCTEGISASIKRNFKKKTTTGFLGVGVKGSAGVIGASAKAGIEVTVNDNNEVVDVGGKMEAGFNTGWGPAKANVSSSASYTVMTGYTPKMSGGLSGKAE